MPTVPMPRQTVGLEPLPAPRVNTQAPIEAFGGGTANAQVDLRPITELAHNIFLEEKQRADEIAVIDASTKATDLQTQLTIRTRQRQGKDAFSAPEDVAEEWQKNVQAIEEGLSNDTQRAAFQRVKASNWNQLNGTVQSHVADQREKYDAQVTDNALKSSLEAAVVHYDDPTIVANEVAKQASAIALHLNKVYNGKIPEGMLENATLMASSATHTAVINKMLANEQDIAAAAYYKAHATEFTAVQGTAIQKEVQQSSREMSGMRAAADVWTKMGPKGLNDPIKLQDIETTLREKLADDPTALKFALQDVEHRANVQNKQQAEVGAANVNAVMGLYNQGTPLSKIQASTPFRALDESKKNEITKYVTSAAKAGRIATEQDLMLTGMPLMWKYTDPKWLSAQTRGTIEALRTKIGVTNTSKLIEEYDRLQAATDKADASQDRKVYPGTFDRTTFLAVAAETGFTDVKGADFNTLWMKTREEISRQAQVKKGPLDEEEKIEAMRKVIGTKLMVDYTLVPDQEVRLSLVDPTDNRMMYAPLSTIPTAAQTVYANMLIANNPALRGMTSAQVIAKNTRTIERMHSASLRGNSALFGTLAKKGTP